MHNYLILIVGVIIFLLAILTLRKELTMRRNGVRTTGVIVAVQRERGEDGTLYRPLVQFVTNDGQPILWKCTSASSFGRNATGKPMRIIYDPRNPQNVIRNHWIGFAAIVILCLMCALCIAIFFGIIPTAATQDDTSFYTSLSLWYMGAGW